MKSCSLTILPKHSVQSANKSNARRAILEKTAGQRLQVAVLASQPSALANLVLSSALPPPL